MLAIQVLAALRKTAREFTQEYIRRQVASRLKSQLLIVAGQTALLLLALAWTASAPGLAPELFASTVLWGITLYNLFQLCFITVPELRALHRTLRGKVGYALKYFLEISLVTELMQLNVIFLALCVVLGISSRTWVGAAFSYTKPWIQLVSPSAPSAPTRTRHRIPRR